MKRYKYYRIVLEVTSFPLAILFYIYILTGYCLINPKIAKALTLGLLTYRQCLLLHTSIELRWLLIVFVLLHSFTGFNILILKIKNKILRQFIEMILVLIILLLLLQFLLLELL